jgi:predicted RNase H-related nuclease YkuK (DUF458 family)
MYLEFADDLENRDVEIHMDISAEERNGSSCVVNEAIGYIRGMCHMEPMVKPDAFAASYAADRYSDAIVHVR